MVALGGVEDHAGGQRCSERTETSHHIYPAPERRKGSAPKVVADHGPSQPGGAVCN